MNPWLPIEWSTTALLKKMEDFNITTRFGDFRLRAYKQTTNNHVHIALTKGIWSKNDKVLTRINSTLINNDILGTLTNHPDKKLQQMFDAINKEEKGAFVFINQDAQSFNLLSRLGELKKLQAKGILKLLKSIWMPGILGGCTNFARYRHLKIRLLTNSTQTKRVGIVGYGLEIVEYVPY